MINKTWSWILVVLTVCISLSIIPYGYKNLKKAGIVDNPLTDTSDPAHISDKRVQFLWAKGLKTGDAISFILPFKDIPTISELTFVRDFTDELKKVFPQYGILSLSNMPNYKDKGSGLLSDPFINDEFLSILQSDKTVLQDWKADIAKDSSVYGLLIGKNYNYASVIMLLPRGYDEIKTFRLVTELLEKRKIPEWQWYFKKDIYPAKEFKNILPAGWLVGRGLMDAALLSSILMSVTIGLLLTRIGSAIALSSKRQALISIIVVGTCFYWIPGVVGLMQSAGIDLYFRVYFLLVFTVVICAGDTYTLRKFMAYNEYRSAHPLAESSEVWKKTRNINEVIFVPAIIAILNFGLLYFLKTRGMWEIGIFSIISICILLFLSLVIVPAMQIVFGGEPYYEQVSFGRFGLKLKMILESIPVLCSNIISPPKPKRYNSPLFVATAIIVPAFLIASFILAHDGQVDSQNAKFIEVKTKPLEYIKDTVVYKAGKYLNLSGNRGFDNVTFLITPKDKQTEQPIYNPAFISRVNEFTEKVAKISGRDANSVIDKIKAVSRESFKRDMPLNADEARDAFQLIESNLDPLSKEQLWFDGGIVISAAVDGEDSNRIDEFSESVVSLSSEFPDLEISPFGKLALYPKMDKYIRQGKPVTVLASQVVMFLICTLWITWKNRTNTSGANLIPWRTGLVMTVPFIFASSIIIIIMATLHIPLDQATATIQALAINAAADFGIYLVYDFRASIAKGTGIAAALTYAIKEKGRIIVMDVMIKVFCFTPLIFSSFIPVSRLGWIMIAMMVACGFGTMVLMPAFLPWCVIKKTSGINEAIN